MAGEPRLPPGRVVELPGRGTTFVRELPGPTGAPTVVLLHGWTVTADLNWFPSYAALGEHFRVVAVDHRGHGRGLRPTGPFRLADCADDLAALVEVLDLDRVILAGYSMGGPVAMLTWYRHRDVVDGLVLCATAPIFRGAGGNRVSGRTLPYLVRAARLAPLPLQRVIARELLGRRFARDDFGQWARRQLSLGDPLTIAEAGPSIGRFDAHAWLADIDVPTSVLRTLHDRIVPLHRQTRLAEQIPGAELFDVDGDHRVCVSDAPEFVPQLVAAARSVGSRLPDRYHADRTEP
ncbi:MAG: alpha/beta hydrolase [Acidimicrobiales bacterium]|nr:alpha/beta hydrolase [Acidimicrobiales bacterium]